MDSLTIDLWTFDVGVEVDTPAAYAQQMTRRVLQSWENGADVVVFPEYAWMGLEQFVEGKERLVKVANLFWKELWPGVQRALVRKDKAAVLGSVPALEGRMLRNRVPILCDGRVLHQDKLHLTPWETVFAPGEVLHLWRLHGITFAVVICLDIEVPELSVALRGSGVDCVLVPSATESVLGVERVGRCASARAVELCCQVGVSQLVGRADSELVDENVGRLAWLNPSQSPFLSAGREAVSELHDGGFHVMRCRVDAAALAAARANRTETNPALLTPKAGTCEIVLHAQTNSPQP
jgi:predicted amidohydrolase